MLVVIVFYRYYSFRTDLEHFRSRIVTDSVRILAKKRVCHDNRISFSPILLAQSISGKKMNSYALNN